MKKYIITLALLVSALAPQMAYADKVEDAIREGIEAAEAKAEAALSKRMTNGQQPTINGGNTNGQTVNVQVVDEDDEEDVTLFSDTTDNELEEDTTTYSTYSSSSNDTFPLGDSLDGVVGVVAIIGAIIILVLLLAVLALPILIIYFVLRSRRKREQERIELIKSLASNEKDATPYLNLMKDSQKKVQTIVETDEYKKGIKNVCLGIGLILFFYLLTHSTGLAAVGFILAAVGAGQIWSSKKAGAAVKTEEPAEPAEPSTPSQETVINPAKTEEPEMTTGDSYQK